MTTDNQNVIGASQALAKHEIVLGQKENGTIVNRSVAGIGLLFEGNSYYVVKLMMFPQNYYFLTKNKDSQTHYTVFSKCLRQPNEKPRFQNPVGYARLNDDLKTHLEITFPILGATSVYMHLFPSR